MDDVSRVAAVRDSSGQARLRFMLRLALTALAFALVVKVLRDSLDNQKINGPTVFAALLIVLAWAALSLGPPSPRLRYCWVPVIPIIGVLGLSAANANVPFKVLWHFAEDDFEAAIPVIIASNGDDAPPSIGGLSFDKPRIIDGGVYFAGLGQHDRGGMAYLPNGAPASGPTILDNVGGDWFEFGFHFGGDPWGEQ